MSNDEFLRFTLKQSDLTIQLQVQCTKLLCNELEGLRAVIGLLTQAQLQANLLATKQLEEMRIQNEIMRKLR